MSRDEILSMFRAHRDDWPDHIALVSVAREIERRARADERRQCALICAEHAAMYWDAIRERGDAVTSVALVAAGNRILGRSA